MLKGYITEASAHSNKVKVLATYLRDYYDPTVGTFKEGGEYHDKPMVLNKVNNEMLTVESLYEHMKYKFNEHDDEFIKQVIRDWYGGKIAKDYSLSKNVRSRK